MSQQEMIRPGLTLGQSEERFRLLVESVVDYAIFILDPQGYITSWNAGAQRLKGYSADEVIGNHFSIFYPPELVAKGHPQHELEIAEAEGRYEEEGWRIRKDGTKFWANVVITALRDNKGDLTGFAKVTRDMTERRHAEELLERRVEERTAELAATNRRVEALNERLVRAMRETHHRVKNNLQVVSAMIDILAETHSELGSVPLSEMDRLRSHVRTMSMVHNLLTRGLREDESEQTLPIKGVFDALLPLLQEMVGPSEIQYSVQEIELPAKQCVALGLVLNELVSNAFRHGGPHIDVVFDADQSHAHLQVSDDGPGFTEGFNPFTSSNLGLDLITSLVSTDLKGDVRFENREGGGALVSLSFPLSA